MFPYQEGPLGHTLVILVAQWEVVISKVKQQGLCVHPASAADGARVEEEEAGRRTDREHASCLTPQF